MYQIREAIVYRPLPRLDILRIVPQDFCHIVNITAILEAQHDMNIRVFRLAVLVHFLIVDDNSVSLGL